MESKIAQILFFTIVLSCYIAQNNAKNQIEALSRIYKEKLKSDTDIDKSHFDASQLFHEAKLLHSQKEEEEEKENDRIRRLPGQPEVKFKQYGGYVTVDPKAGRAFYYYFVEAQRSHKILPLLLWLNGGPGCSSLAYGAMQELGPFRVHSDGKTLYKNKFAWNHGVGFSYSNTTADVVSGGDKRTAMDNYEFLLNWLERFPEYKNREFYISGESYAGHYVPQLAHIILRHNHKSNKTIINLKGIIIGNAVINDETDMKGMYEYFGSHALISDDTAYQIMKYCDFSPNATKLTDRCSEAVSDADKNVETIDIYNIYAPLCSNSNLTDKPKKNSIFNFDPCGENYVYAYLNRPEVQKALHANVTSIPYDWQPCSNVLRKWQDSPSTVIPHLKEFMANGLRVWIFSGDIDGRIPVTSTQLSIKKMKIPIKTSWYPWYLSGEVGGYTTVYEGNLTFTTVRGAGHQVPSYQPLRALSLIMHFLDGTELPNSSRK
ncbi:serine carboxypeptidase-like 40 [Phtheirospermum japonicum]|uniref:Carboxypeptidase n=1 Tax=Phtheirospermum japonicum TaxID=374723 RepID=A0A830BQI3_9LAMI|nr:serine carboxypeptidase-like 40 [Phtheirospermum japonicum]